MSLPTHYTTTLADEAATQTCGAALAQALQSGTTVWLLGELGAGKTCLARAMLQAVGWTGRVKSPTYTLVEPYPLGEITWYHFDLYRFNDPSEWELGGFSEYFNATSICLIEWPSQAGDYLPTPDWRISLNTQATGRRLTLDAASPTGQLCLNRFLT